MNKALIISVLAVSFFAGCASVPMASKEKTEIAKKFNPPSAGNSGLYLYRSGIFGAALKKDIWVDGKCVGETAPNTFFYEEVKGGQEHKISTESEFSPNDLLLKTEPGKNYFIQQYIKIGVLVAGAGLELVNDEKGQQSIHELEMASTGVCSQ